MQLHELLNVKFKTFKLKNGRKLYDRVYVDGDRRRIRIERTEKNGKSWTLIRRYVKPHTEVEIVNA